MPGGFETERKLYVVPSDLSSPPPNRTTLFTISDFSIRDRTQVKDLRNRELTTEISYDRSKTSSKKLRLNLISPIINEIFDLK